MEIKQLIDDYIHWLKKEITFEKIGEYYEITTPFLNSANDFIQIYVRIDKDTIFFTDDGYTLNQLYMNGFQLTSTRKNTLISLLQQYGVTLNGDALETTSEIDNFAQKKHMFLQAIIRVDDMYMVTRNKTTSYFFDDIQNFFNN